MAYNSNQLSPLSYTNGFTLWHYRDMESDISMVLARGYFDAAAAMFRVGDVLFINTPGETAIAAVKSNTGGVVEVGFMAETVDAW